MTLPKLQFRLMKIVYVLISCLCLAIAVAVPPSTAWSQEAADKQGSDSQSALSLYRKGVALRQDEALAAAAASLRAAVRADPSLAEARRELIEVYLQDGEHNLAFAAIADAMKAETRKNKADLAPFLKLMERVDMERVDAKEAAAQAAQVEAADLAAQKPVAQKASEANVAVGQWKVGDFVEVEWSKAWYPAKIIDAKDDSYKIRYDGYSATWDEWVTPKRMRRRLAASSDAAQKAGNVAPPKSAPQRAPQNNNGPRTGKYYMLSYGSPYNPPINLGHFVLMPGGRYRASNTSKEEYYGEGKYSYDAKAGAINWLSGPFKRNEWGGKFTVTREGKTHRIELTRSTIGFNDLK